MSYGQFQSFTVSIPSLASTSDYVHFQGKPPGKMLVQVPTMSTAAQISLQHSIDDGTTFYNVFHPSVNSSSPNQLIQTNQFIITSGVGVNGGAVELIDAGFQSIRFVATGTVRNGVVFKIICSP